MPDRFLSGQTDAAQTGVQDKRRTGLSRAKPGTGVNRNGRQRKAFEAAFPVHLARSSYFGCEELKNRF
jgi:hypothetical protein